MSSKRTKKRKIKKENNHPKKIINLQDEQLKYYDALYDPMFCGEVKSTPEGEEHARNNLRKLILMQPMDNLSKLRAVAKDDLIKLLDFNDECFNKYKKETGGTYLSLPTFVQKNIPIETSIMIHEEILWMFSRNYAIENQYKKLIYATEIIWHCKNGESHKSPDLIFKYSDNIQFGIEVTWTRPGTLRASANKPIREIPKSWSDNFKINQYEALEKAIDKKSSKNNLIMCKNYFLVVLTNPMDGHKGEFAGKVMLQEHADNYLQSKEESIFSKVLIA